MGEILEESILAGTTNNILILSNGAIVDLAAMPAIPPKICSN